MTFISQAHEASLDDDQRAELLMAHSIVGFHPETLDSLFIPNKDRYSGMSITGLPGSGKSGLLANLIDHDILLGYAVIVIDPHGDLIRDCIARMPDNRLARTYLLDMEDEAYPFGVNLFGDSTNKVSTIAHAQAVDRVMHVFEVLWPDILSQAHLPRFLRAACIVLFANPGSTLVDMQRLLLDSGYRAKMLRATNDQSVQQFWQYYDSMSATQQHQQVEPLIGRLESLFMGRPSIRNIVGQRVSSINFRAAIENCEVIFIPIPIKTLAQDARLIGTLLIAQLHAAIFSFADMPEEKRPGFSLYVDEFQHFATPDFSEMFTEGRKFGVRVTVAHQYRGQLPINLKESTMTARTKICFRMTVEDSREMAHLFLGGEATMRPEDIEARPVEHLLRYGSDSPPVQTFIDDYIRPMQAQKQSGGIEIVKPGARWDQAPYWVLSVEAPKEKPKVADPTPYLNHILYEVMKTGDGNLPIPPEVVYGFSNCSGGFYPDFHHALNKGMLLSSEVRFPAALVVEGANGLRWTRPPENDKEQLYHFLFFLRATMVHLASNPIGKKSSLSAADVAHMLTQLPKRAAFVHSGEDVGVIYTLDTLPPVDDATISKRFYLIRGQTRQKYCHPVSQPSDNTMAGSPVEEPELSRWEEVQ